MDALRRLTEPTVAVLRVLVSREGPAWGLAIIRESGLAAGTVYPLLDRLERLGWVTSRWEDNASRSGPRRRFYEFTGEGAIAATRAIATFDSRRRRTVVGAAVVQS